MNSRIKVIIRHPDLQRHKKYFEKLDAVHMSGDELEVDRKGNPVIPRQYRKVDAKWQSDALVTFFDRLDRQYAAEASSTVGKQGSSGNPPRTRPPSKGKSVNSRAPSGMPHSWYNPKWYRKLPSWEKDALDAQEEDYDFSLPDGLGEDDSDSEEEI